MTDEELKKSFETIDGLKKPILGDYIGKLNTIRNGYHVDSYFQADKVKTRLKRRRENQKSASQPDFTL